MTATRRVPFAPSMWNIPIRTEEGQKLREALVEVMGWIDNWNPPFTEDDDWGATEDRIHKALKETDR